MRTALITAGFLIAVIHVGRAAAANDCSTLNFKLRKVPRLCGKVSVTVFDLVVDPLQYGLDNEFDVQLRDKAGRTLESKRLSYKTDRTFCFTDRPRGRYAVAIVLYKRGVAEPAMVFPIKYTGAADANVAYLVPPGCPKQK